MKNQITKSKHAAGGYVYKLAEVGNFKFSNPSKTQAIISALNDSWVDSVFTTPEGKIQRQMLNGVIQSLQRDDETNEFFFA